MDRIPVWVGVVFVALMVLIPNAFLFDDWQECRAKDGAFVRTTLWYDCLEKQR